MDDRGRGDLLPLLQEKLGQGEALLAALHDGDRFAAVEGLPKLEKKIKQEIKFLRRFTEGRGAGGRGQGLKSEHLQCSNLQHLSAIVDALLSCSGPNAVLHTFSCPSHDAAFAPRKVTVDVVSRDWMEWTKVVARNPKALDLNSRGGNQFGQRSILDQVGDFVKCAKANTRLFRAPAVVFVFHNGVSDALARKLHRKGVEVRGEILPSDPVALVELDSESGSSDDEEASDSEDSSHSCDDLEASQNVSVLLDELDTSALNLDITAMIAYVSALTNGHADFTFKEPILSEQAAWERERPVKPVLERLFAGKRLVCCQSAMRDFQAILGTLGGNSERQRAEQLLKHIEVVEDQVSPRLAHLDMSGKIKERSRAIFGTGDRLKMMTVTANSGFVRAARGQGIELTVALHESRALTEDKMSKGHATSIGSQVARED